MGFRSMLVSEHLELELPAWFVVKYTNYLHFYEGYKMPFSTKREMKEYGWQGEALVADIQTVVGSDQFKAQVPDKDGLEILWFHECGGVTKAVIRADSVRYYEPEREWIEEEGVTHDYCHGCWEPKG